MKDVTSRGILKKVNLPTPPPHAKKRPSEENDISVQMACLLSRRTLESGRSRTKTVSWNAMARRERKGRYRNFLKSPLKKWVGKDLTALGGYVKVKSTSHMVMFSNLVTSRRSSP